MAELQFPNIAGAVFDGYEFGNRVRQQRDAEKRQSALSALASQAYGAPRDQQTSLLSQMASVSPQAAAQQQEAFQNDDDRRNKTMVNMAKMLVAAPKQARAALYRQMLPTLGGFGLENLPSDYTDESASTIDQAANALVQAYGGATSTADQQNFAAMTQGFTPEQIQEARLIQAGLRPRAGLPSIQDTGNGYYGIDRRTLEANPVTTGGRQGMPMGGLDLTKDYQQFASLGIPVTSTVRTPERNTAVGGVPNSFHLSGEAIDIAPRTAQEKEQARQYWQQRGYQVIDEQDHLHIEPPGRGMTTSQLRSAPKAQQPSDLERRLSLADQMGATDEEKRRMVIGGESGRDAQRISAKDATTARQKLTQIQAARQQLNAVKQAFNPIRNSYSAGLGGAYLPTPEGQAFDRAIRNLSPLITAVTRVPGVGAMSDYESKLQEAGLPSRGTYEAVTDQQIGDLERLLDTVEAGYQDLLSGNSSQAPQSAPAPSGWSIQKVN